MKKRVLQGIETKKRLIECARKLFHEKGYYSVSVDDIIREAHSSKGSFYTHFKTKEELIINLLPLIDEKYYAFLRREPKNNNSIDEIASFTHYVLKTIKEEVGLEFISAIYASQIKDLTGDHFLIASERGYYNVLKRLFEEGRERNEINAALSTEYMIDIITSCMRGVIYDWCLKKGEFDLPVYGGEIINMLLNQMKNTSFHSESNCG